MSKTNKQDKCPSGMIEKEGYTRKGHIRKSYTRKDGTKVSAAIVSETDVPPVCVKDVGKPGKGPKILPKPRNEIKLHTYGYSTKKTDAQRHEALKDAAHDFGLLKVLRRMNLLRNYQSVPSVKAVFNRDVEYLKKQYSKEKDQEGGAEDIDRPDISGPYTSRAYTRDVDTSDSTEQEEFYDEDKDYLDIDEELYEDDELSGGKKNLKCPPGTIQRDGYIRKGYNRKEYLRKDGTRVAASHVSATAVDPTCVADQGKPGKGPKTLPEPDKLIQLHTFGYSIKKNKEDRHKALRDAAAASDLLLVYRRLNLLRNYQANAASKAIFDADVDYLKKLYAKQKKTHGTSRRSYAEREFEKDVIRTGQVGGVDDISDIEIEVETVGFPEKDIIINKQYDTKQICDDKGKCENVNYIMESHKIDNKEVIFYTLDEKDADDILVLDKAYLDSDATKQQVLDKLAANKGFLIGIKADGKLQGYAQYHPIENNEVKIDWFNANKGYGTPLYLFLQKLFKRNSYTRATIIISLEGSYAVRRVNFWCKMGFNIYEINLNDKKMLAEKKIL
jgi:hypothetical protein